MIFEKKTKKYKNTCEEVRKSEEFRVFFNDKEGATPIFCL